MKPWALKLLQLFQRRHYRVEVDEKVCISVAQGTTILKALLKAGINYPHNCCMGDCGTCKSLLITGKVRASGYLESALSEAEAEAGIFLPCSSSPLSDCKIAYGKKLNAILKALPEHRTHKHQSSNQMGTLQEK